jgi:hypothetical protein
MSTSRLPVISQIALPKRHRAPAVELAAVDHTLGAEIENIFGF